MAVIAELDVAEWRAWVSTRPAAVQELCRRLPPARLYRLKDSGHRVTMHSYSEDGTVTVIVSGEYNAVVFDRQVFGISPDDLEECDLPAADEPLGTLLTEGRDIDQLCETVRKENVRH